MDTVLGTPAYVAPEIIEGEEASPLSDIYSLGILLYRLVTGRTPFEGTSMAAVLRGHLEGAIVPVFRPGGPPECLDTVIGNCIARDPNSRYLSADLVSRDLEACLAGRRPIGVASREIVDDLPFWARFIPGAERTIIDVRAEVGEARRKSDEAKRELQKIQRVVLDLECALDENLKCAADWRVVAERALSEDDEEEARVALGHAKDYDNHAAAYHEELERQRQAIVDLRKNAAEVQRASAEVETRGAILLSRRSRARLLLKETMQRNPRPLAVFVIVLSIAALVIVAVATAFHIRGTWHIEGWGVRQGGVTVFSTIVDTPVVKLAGDPSRLDAPGRFREVTDACIPPGIHGDALAVGDVNGDGFDDVIAYSNVAPTLLLNDGRGHFIVGPKPPFSNQTARVLFADVDGDGDLDAFTSYGGRGTADFFQRQNNLYLNNGKGVFIDVTATHLPNQPTWTEGAVLFDADGDGDPDLFLACGFGGLPIAVPPIESIAEQDRFYQNDGSGRFMDVSERWLPKENDISMGASVADLNGDGDLDLVINRRNAPLKILTNEGKRKFIALSNCVVPAEMWTFAGNPVLLDIDQDGDVDAFLPGAVFGGVGSTMQTRLFLNNGSGSFYDMSGAWVPRYAQSIFGDCAVLDINEDGYPDILSPQGESFDAGIGEHSFVPINVYAGGASAMGWIGREMFGFGRYALPDSSEAPTPYARWIALIDFDRDGDSDVITSASNAAKVGIWENTGGF
jgi:hypothetical protein